jgi:integrase/recombinase XerD
MEASMFTQFFSKDHWRYSESPAAYWLQGFAAWLTSMEYSHHATRQHLFRLKRVLERYAPVAPDCKFVAHLLPALFVSPTEQPEYTGTRRAFERFLAAQGSLVTTPVVDRFALVLSRYERHLIELRGLKKNTIADHLKTVSEFLTSALPVGAELDALSMQKVEEFLAIIGARQSRQSMQHSIAHLRSFLRFSHDHGDVPCRLYMIDTPQTCRGELPPRALAWPVVEALLRSIDRSTAMGCRDHAILFLMAQYGLRPVEVITLTPTSIDWSARTLRVQQCKTASELLLPLSDKALRVLGHYLRYARPESARPELFLRARSPGGHLTNTAVAEIYLRRAKESGLPLSGSSSYCLRHSFAMRLLNRGVGIKTIGDLLGHRSLESTCVYLRLQTEALRSVGLPVPRTHARACAGRTI